MKIGLISGSQRKSSQSTKVAYYCQSRLSTKGVNDSFVFDLGENPLPIWEPGMWEKNSDIKIFWNQISADLVSADGYIILCPEYAGMASPALKNLFLYFNTSDLAHKPGLIISVSSGIGGAYPISELRASSYKNTRILYVPDHVIVRYVETVLNGVDPVSADDEKIRTRIDYAITVFLQYVPALHSIRNSGTIDLKQFPTGM